MLHWVIRPEHRFHTGIDYTSSVHPSLSLDISLPQKEMTKPPKNPLIFWGRGEHRKPLGPAERWISLLRNVTATNDKAHQAYSMPIQVREKRVWKQTKIEWCHPKMIKETTFRAPVQGLASAPAFMPWSGCHCESNFTKTLLIKINNIPKSTHRTHSNLQFKF